MSDTDARIGKRLGVLRGEMSQANLAAAMAERGHRWSQATVWSVETAKRPLRLAEAEDVAEILDAAVVDLLARDASTEVLRDLERSAVDLHLHGIGIGNAVLAYLSKQDEVRALIEVLPQPPADATSAELERRRNAMTSAEYELSVPYQWHADEALVPDDETRQYDPEIDGKGWSSGVDPEAS